MKGNIVVETRNLVKKMYSEGHSEVLAVAVVDKINGVEVQVADFSFNHNVLPEEGYEGTYAQANKTMRLAKERYGEECKAINILIGDEKRESVFLDNYNILKVDCLNIDMK